MKAFARLLLPLVACAAGLGVSIPTASASNGAQQFNAAGFDLPLGGGGGGANIPPNCPFTGGGGVDLLFLSGNGVSYQNGSGVNVEGIGQFTVTNTDLSTAVYVGHAHFWGGTQPNNLTLTFNGSGASGNLSVQIVGNKPHVIQLLNISCS